MVMGKESLRFFYLFISISVRATEVSSRHTGPRTLG